MRLTFRNVLALSTFSSVRSFVLPSARGGGATSFTRRIITTSQPMALPTVDELKSDPFMKQVGHAGELVTLLSQEENDDLTTLLTAQLSHSDGIRGFFVNYLSGEEEGTAADDDVVPPPLVSAIEAVENTKDLVSLAAMNVIMPTAMTTMHTDPGLQKASTQTAKRGIKVFQHLGQTDKYRVEVQEVTTAILAAAGESNGTDDEEAKEFWRNFFTKWGYKEQQSNDIVAALKSIYL